MMLPAQRNEVAEVGRTSVFPFVYVMKLAPREWSVAAIPSASSVNGAGRLPLSVGCGPIPTTHIDGHTSLIQHDPLDHSVAGDAGDRLGWQRPAIDGFPHGIGVAAAHERLPVDDHADVTAPGSAVFALGQQLERCGRGEVWIFLQATLVRQPGEMRLERILNRLVALRVERAVHVAHARSMIEP